MVAALWSQVVVRCAGIFKACIALKQPRAVVPDLQDKEVADKLNALLVH